MNMKEFIIILAVICAEACDISEVPYQVSIQKFGSHICSGAIISKNLVLTSAHCVSGSVPADISIRAGNVDSGGSVHTVDIIIFLPKLISLGPKFDPAIVRLIISFIWSRTVQPIALSSYVPQDGHFAMTSGWDKSSSGSFTQLQSLQITIINKNTCQQIYKDFDTQRMICAGLLGQENKGAFQGDFGAPLVVNGELVGVASWGKHSANGDFLVAYVGIASLSSAIYEQIIANINEK